MTNLKHLNAWQGLLLLASAALPVAAQQPGASISVTPESLVARPGQEARALIVVRNSSEGPLSALRLTALTDSGMQVRFSDSVIKTLPQGSAVGTMMLVSRDSGSKRPTAITIRADYLSGKGKIPGVSVGTLRLVADRLESASQAADVKLSSTAGMLTEREPGKVYVIVTNKTDLPLEVRRIRSRGPVFTKVDTSLGGSIPAYGMEAYEINLQANQRVQPGKHIIFFDVALAWTSASGIRTGNVALPHEVDVGVFGESAVLKVLSVPSFLLLPGFLMIVAFGLAWQFHKLRRGGKAVEAPLKPTSSDFWIVAITLSGLMALLLPRDYLTAYGTRDLVEVWLISIGLGTVAGTLWFFWTHLWRTPSAKDSPVTVLRKLGRQSLDIEREKVRLDGGDSRYVLERASPEEGPVWVGPTIAVKWATRATSDDRERFDTLRSQRKARPLANFLAQAQARHVVQVTWEPENATPIRAAKFTSDGMGQILEPVEG